MQFDCGLTSEIRVHMHTACCDTGRRDVSARPSSINCLMMSNCLWPLQRCETNHSRPCLSTTWCKFTFTAQHSTAHYSTASASTSACENKQGLYWTCIQPSYLQLQCAAHLKPRLPAQQQCASLWFASCIITVIIVALLPNAFSWCHHGKYGHVLLIEDWCILWDRVLRKVVLQKC